MGGDFVSWKPHVEGNHLHNLRFGSFFSSTPSARQALRGGASPAPPSRQALRRWGEGAAAIFPAPCPPPPRARAARDGALAPGLERRRRRARGRAARLGSGARSGARPRAWGDAAAAPVPCRGPEGGKKVPGWGGWGARQLGCLPCWSSEVAPGSSGLRWVA